MCAIIAIVQAVIPYKHIVMSNMLTYVGTSSLIAIDVGLINGQFIILSALFTSVSIIRTTPSLVMYYVCTLCMIV